MSDDPFASTERFFDELGAGYDGAIERCVPRYREMLASILTYIPETPTPRRVLDLGCGTGNLSALVAERFPGAIVVSVDISIEILKALASRHDDEHRPRVARADMRQLPVANGTVDLIVSSIAIHHLVDDDKRALFSEIHRALRPGGVFTYSDQFAGATDDLYARHMAIWRERAAALGAPDDEWAAWMKHQDLHDHHSPIGDQMDWLRGSGFAVVDCVWRYALWTVLQARKAN
jgi:tRNA (cmo5U34)-methyltransferase